MRVATTGPTLTHKVVLSLAICAGLGWGGRCVFKSCDEWQGLLLLFCIRAMFTNHGDMKSNLISAYHFIGVKLTKETRWTCNMKALYIIMFFLYAIANHCTTVQFLDINIWCSSCVLSGPFECMHLTYFFDWQVRLVYPIICSLCCRTLLTKPSWLMSCKRFSRSSLCDLGQTYGWLTKFQSLIMIWDCKVGQSITNSVATCCNRFNDFFNVLTANRSGGPASPLLQSSPALQKLFSQPAQVKADGFLALCGSGVVIINGHLLVGELKNRKQCTWGHWHGSSNILCLHARP